MLRYHVLLLENDATAEMTYLDRIKLHASLHNVDRCEGSMGEGTANTSSNCRLDIVHKIILAEVGVARRCGEEYRTGVFHGHFKR